MQKAIAPDVMLFDADDDEGWEDMPIVRETDEFANGLDEEDQKKYHYTPQVKKDLSTGGAGNATGALLDIDYEGQEWRSKIDQNESEYTRLRMKEEEEADEVHLRTRYLFDEDQAMTPLSQMQQTKNMLTEAQRIAYVGLCSLTSREMTERLKRVNSKELKPAVQNMELWALKILGRLYYHMELATAEQKMIENLGLHGVQPDDLVPSLMTTHTVANPEYDPDEARRQADRRKEEEIEHELAEEEEEEEEKPPIYVESDDISETTMVEPNTPKTSPTLPQGSPQSPGAAANQSFQTTSRVLENTSTASMPGVSTSLSSADEKVTLDIRWTVLCDLFLILIADSVYDARSRVLLEQVAIHLGLGWLDVVKFEQRVTEALEIQEGVENIEQREIIEGRQKSSRKRRYVMMGLATLGGGLVIGLSAGLLAPVIGAGLGAAFTTIGISGTAGFLAGTGGAAVITTGGVLTGSSIAVKGMARRTQQVRTFDLLPLHNNKRVNCIITVPGFMNGLQDDVRLPFSVLDPIVGDVFSVLWEPEMIRETGSALGILTGEVLSQIGQTVLQATVMTALMSALQWPIILTKLGYLIDNPWNNALDRAKAAGSVLADVLIKRHLGVRPITLIGFSLGARVIFYALLEIARQKAFGIVQDVFLLGATLTASQKTWYQARSAVSGRFVNGFARNDWVLNYLFRATSGGLATVAGLRPVENVPGLENVDVTDKIAGHMSYRTFMPLILDQLGFPVSADHFDEPEEPDFEEDRIVVREGEEFPKKKSWFSRKTPSATAAQHDSRPPTAVPTHRRTQASVNPALDDDELPPREPAAPRDAASAAGENDAAPGDIAAELPKVAGFDLAAMKAVIGDVEPQGGPARLDLAPPIPPSSSAQRAQSAPPHVVDTPTPELTPTREQPLGSIAGPSDLTATFSRSLSLNDMRGAQEDEDEEDDEEDEQTSYHPFAASPPVQSSSRASPGPALAFGAGDGALWAPEVPEKDLFGGFGSPYGNPFRPAAAVPSTTSLGASTNFAAATVERDPWSSRPSLVGDKKASSFSSNPWDS
ncbi:DUF726-domain-containing protein [Artomyces pyxidatus]|uniref:DUF726-domain-containing protein n=1 Tax=Artomyces pyxidatus TaxID=48021 RepID=A0ACB8TDN4_9AGAM|nr:DUF726-domain-containing protein [Artomyces pyxidatus]